MYAKLFLVLVSIALSTSNAFGSPMKNITLTKAAGYRGLIRLASTGYSVGLSEVNYFQASLNCRQNNLFLVSIESLQEQIALEGLIRQHGLEMYDFWTSGSDLAYKEHFFWASTGLPLTYKNFDVGEPNNNGGSEDCIQMKRGTVGFKWNDKPCDVPNFYFCEAL